MLKKRPMFLGATLAVGLATAALVGPSTVSLAATRHRVSPATANLANLGVAKACAKVGVVHPRCLAEVLTTSKSSKVFFTSSTPMGYGPATLAKAYDLPGPGVGSTNTIAILDEGADPNLAGDLAVYRSTYGLPACTTANGCFAQYGERGGAPLAPGTSRLQKLFDQEVAVETSLDVDMASAACPSCHIIEITVARDILASNDVAASSFGPAVNTAVQLGASSVSISYQFAPDATLDHGAVTADFFHPGVAIEASSGDSGYEGAPDGWPQDLQSVVSVGGTALYTAGPGKFEEVGWDGGGSGCATDVPPAFGQPPAVSAVCGGFRASTDVSADADPNTGVAIYDSYAPYNNKPYGWLVVGGTSVSSPFVAGLFARAGHLTGVEGPNKLYGDPSSDFNDIVAGNNYAPGACKPIKICTAGPGWDGPTGLGSPHGLRGF